MLDLYPDTKGCSPSLVRSTIVNKTALLFDSDKNVDKMLNYRCSSLQANFFNTQKKTSGNKNSKGSPQTFPTICHRPLSSYGSVERKDFEEPRSYTSSSPNLGFAVKQLTPTDLQGSLLSGKNENGRNPSEPPVKVNRNLGTHHKGIWDNHFIRAQVFERITYITVLGCVAFASMKLFRMNPGKTVTGSNWAFTKANNCSSWAANSSADYTIGSTYIRRSSIANKLMRIMSMVKIQFLRRPDTGSRSDLYSALTSSSSPINVYRRLMPVEEAETLIREWQTIKAEALGPSHEVNGLAQVLDESMLAQVMPAVVFFNHFFI